MHKEKVYSCNFMGFKRKADTLVRIKEKVRSLVPSLLIKLSQVLSLCGRKPSLVRTTLNLCVIISTLLSWYY